MLKKAYLEITNCCNLSCSFCHGTERAKRFMSRDEFNTLTDKLSGRIDYLYFHLLGEPLLHPELIDFILIAKRKGFKPVITTNGTLLKAKGAELLESGLYKISISLHSAEANSAFASPEYIESCAEFGFHAADKGIITVLRLWNGGGLDSENSRIISLLKDMFSGEWSETRSGFKLRDKVFLEFGRKFEWPDLSLPELGESFFCYGLRDQVGILVDGTVVPCCLDAEGDIPLGNLFEESLEDILSSKRAQNIYNSFSGHTAAEALCKRCGYAAITKQYRMKAKKE